MREREWTTLHLAAGAADLDRVVALLRAGADPRAIAGVDDQAGRSALHCAVDLSLLMGRTDDATRARVVAVLLEAGAPVDGRDREGMTPLLLAAKAGLVRCCELLLDAGASIGAVDRDRGWTALHVTRSVDVAALLLDRGADPDAAARHAYEVNDHDAGARLTYPTASTPADVAVIRDQPAMLELLATRGGTRVTTAGHSDAQRAYARASARGDLATAARLLAEHGFQAFRPEGRPPLLHEALAECRPELAMMLIEAGHPLEQRDESGRTALLVAIQRRQLDLARMLVARGADVLARDATGATALHLTQDPASIERLLQLGVEVDARDLQGRTALHRSSYDPAALRALLRIGASPDVADEEGVTPLAAQLREPSHHALASIVAILLEAGANPDVDVPAGPRARPQPALITLVQSWRLWRADSCGEALAALLRGGADPDRADRKGWTALHEATHYRMVQAIALLRGAGARDDLPTSGRVRTYPAGTTAAAVGRARGVA